MTTLQRVRLRVPDVNIASDDLLNDYISVITDRLNLRLGTENLPAIFESIVVDAVVKMYRRTYYEGISSEGVANISTSFVEDILAEYEREISDWKSSHAGEEGTANRVVSFL